MKYDKYLSATANSGRNQPKIYLALNNSSFFLRTVDGVVLDGDRKDLEVHYRDGVLRVDGGKNYFELLDEVIRRSLDNSKCGYVNLIESDLNLSLDFIPEECLLAEHVLSVKPSDVSVGFYQTKPYVLIKTDVYEAIHNAMKSNSNVLELHKIVDARILKNPIVLTDEQKRVLFEAVISYEVKNSISKVRRSLLSAKRANDVAMMSDRGYTNIITQVLALSDTIPIGFVNSGFEDVLIEEDYVDAVRFVSEYHPIYDTPLVADLSLIKVTSSDVYPGNESCMMFTTAKRFSQAYNVRFLGSAIRQDIDKFMLLYLGKYFKYLNKQSGNYVKVQGSPDTVQLVNVDSGEVIDLELIDEIPKEQFEALTTTFKPKDQDTGSLSTFYVEEVKTSHLFAKTGLEVYRKPIELRRSSEMALHNFKQINDEFYGYTKVVLSDV